jgi:CheY-like chemotaxis protein
MKINLKRRKNGVKLTERIQLLDEKSIKEASVEKILRIVIAEDEPEMRSSLERLLRRVLKEEFTLTSCSDGTEALAAIYEQKVDILITDNNMPGLNGSQMFQKIEELAPEKKPKYTLFISGEVSAPSGDFDFLSKLDLNKATLAALIEKGLTKSKDQFDECGLSA